MVVGFKTLILDWVGVVLHILILAIWEVGTERSRFKVSQVKKLVRLSHKQANDSSTHL
jgi:hypothetical protein